MSVTVWGAFNSFRVNTVDLATSVSDKARTSRDYLYDQLKARDKDDPYFPDLAGSFIPFGSFARKTKIRPLDDIDTLLLLNGSSTTAVQSPNDTNTYWLKIDSSLAPLSLFPDDHGYVNSTKVLNSIKSSLASVANYTKADISKNMHAIVLKLNSYDWAFDIVPGVPIRDWQGSISHYLIPNGSGDWIRTDPRKDQDYITKVNKRHNGNLLPVMRLLKYWNRRVHKPRLMPYYFETLVLKVFEYAAAIDDFPKAINYFFQNCSLQLFATCYDPKGLGAALDGDVDYETKNKVYTALKEAATNSGYALMYEGTDDSKSAIYWWRDVFGTEFPTYG